MIWLAASAIKPWLILDIALTNGKLKASVIYSFVNNVMSTWKTICFSVQIIKCGAEMINLNHQETLPSEHHNNKQKLNVKMTVVANTYLWIVSMIIIETLILTIFIIASLKWPSANFVAWNYTPLKLNIMSKIAHIKPKTA